MIEKETLSPAYIRQGIRRINEEAQRIQEEEKRLRIEKEENEKNRQTLQGLCKHASGRVRKDNNPHYECPDCGAELGRAIPKFP